MEERPETISSERIFEGRIFRLRVDRVRFDDGTTQRLDIIEHPGSFGIIATTPEDAVVLVRQYRHPAGRALWEIPAGTAELGEDALAGAARELREETGYRARSMRALGTTYVTPGFCDEKMHLFYANELEAGEQLLDEDERITVGEFDLERAEALVAQGEIADLKTILALAWLRGPRLQLAPKTVDI